MFASSEVATSSPSLTAIKGYDFDESSHVPLMEHLSQPKNTMKGLPADAEKVIIKRDKHTDRHLSV